MKRVKFFIGVLCIGLLFTACSDSDEETTKHVSNSYYVEYETLKSLYEAGSIDNVTAFLESKGFERYSQTAITQTEDKVVYMKVNDGETVVFHLCVDNTNNTIKSLHYYIPDESKSELLNVFNAYSSALQKVYSSAGYNGVLIDKYELLDNAYRASGGFEDGSYLIPHPREQAEKYIRRKNMSYYINYVKPVVDGHVNPIFKSKPIRKGLSPTYEKFIQDVDGNGTTLTRFMKKAAIRAKLHGVEFIIVDMEQLEEGQIVTEKDIIEQRLYPYLYLVSPSQVNNWALDKFGRLIYFSYTITNNVIGEDGITYNYKGTKFPYKDLCDEYFDSNFVDITFKRYVKRSGEDHFSLVDITSNDQLYWLTDGLGKKETLLDRLNSELLNTQEFLNSVYMDDNAESDGKTRLPGSKYFAKLNSDFMNGGYVLSPTSVEHSIYNIDESKIMAETGSRRGSGSGGSGTTENPEVVKAKNELQNLEKLMKDNKMSGFKMPSDDEVSNGVIFSNALDYLKTVIESINNNQKLSKNNY